MWGWLAQKRKNSFLGRHLWIRSVGPRIWNQASEATIHLISYPQFKIGFISYIDSSIHAFSSANDRAVFKWLSKVIMWLQLLRLVIGLKDLHQFFNQWEAKSKPIAPCTRDFSRASSELQVIARNCDWFIALSAPVVIGRSNCFGLVFRQSFENRSIHNWGKNPRLVHLNKIVPFLIQWLLLKRQKR